MNLACQQRTRPQLPGDELIRGIQQFNQGRYSECCRTLEFISLHEPRQERYLYQGIIQLAVGLNLWLEEDYRGTLRQIRIGCDLLRGVTPLCLHVDVSGLILHAENMKERLEQLGMERMREFDPKLLPRIRMVK